MIETTHQSHVRATIVVVHPAGGRRLAHLPGTVIEVSSILDAIGLVARGSEDAPVAAVIAPASDLLLHGDAANAIKRVHAGVRIVAVGDAEQLDALRGARDVDHRLPSDADAHGWDAALAGLETLPPASGGSRDARSTDAEPPAPSAPSATSGLGSASDPVSAAALVAYERAHQSHDAAEGTPEADQDASIGTEAMPPHDDEPLVTASERRGLTPADGADASDVAAADDDDDDELHTGAAAGLEAGDDDAGPRGPSTDPRTVDPFEVFAAMHLPSEADHGDAAASTAPPDERHHDTSDSPAPPADESTNGDAPEPLSFAEAVRAQESDASLHGLDRQLGDIDLVDAVLDGEHRLVPVAVELIREQTGWLDLEFEPGPTPSPSETDHATADVVDAGRRFGHLASLTAAAADLEAWSEWLARWLELSRRFELYREQSLRDELTGAWNRRYLMRFLESALHEARGRRRPVTVMVFDIDDFKRFNDDHGHEAGDVILRETVALLRSVTRRSDRVCRIGGDEFAVIFADLDEPRAAGSRPPDDVGVLARRFREQVARLRFPKLGLDAPGTLSISAGLATFPWDGSEAEALLRLADQRALASKRKGKNHITFGPGIALGGAGDAPADAPRRATDGDADGAPEA